MFVYTRLPSCNNSLRLLGFSIYFDLKKKKKTNREIEFETVGLYDIIILFVY